MALSGTPEEVFAQTDALRDAGIEPPVLADLFESLKKRGWDVSVPLTVDQALEELDYARVR
jgi:cobalt/nickel transport system ATP-binding protein